MGTSTVEYLLARWEESYKKGLLSFWLLLLLAQRRAYPYEMKEAVAEISRGSIVAEENSIYRALRRLAESGVVGSEVLPSQTGPDRRYFFLTPKGRELLGTFTERNIRIFQDPEFAFLLEQVTNPSQINEKG